MAATNYIKSIYGRTCVVLALAIWLGYVTYTTLSMSFMMVPALRHLPAILPLTLLCMAIMAIYVWPRTSYLNEPATVNSGKATIGLFLLTIALIAFPGMQAIAYLLSSSNPGKGFAVAVLGYSLISLPIFIFCSLPGLALTWGARTSVGKVTA